MLQELPLLFAAYPASSAVLSFGMAKLSPTISARFRTIFAGFSPLTIVFGEELLREDSFALTGTDLAGVGGLVVLGTAVAAVVTRKTSAQKSSSRAIR